MSDNIAQALHIPSVFYGVQQSPEALAALRALVASTADVGDPNGPWFIADNLITYGHTRGFLTEPRFVTAVLSEQPSPDELSIAWRTHALCWTAENCLGVPGDFVECGSYQGYSMAVVLRYLAGLPGHRCYLYDLFDPSGDEGTDVFDRVRARFQRYDNVSVTRGKVPEILDEIAPQRIAFMHIAVKNAHAERGALEALFDRVSEGGMILFDDYGWMGYREQKQAADAFMRQYSLYVLELPTGQGLVVKR